MGRNDRFINRGVEELSRLTGNSGFHGEVAVRFKVQAGVIQTGVVEKSTRVSPKGDATLVEKTTLKDS